ncbi:unnamed protein product [Ilex paraguariensis]|uniref:Uncharacterized protein n=1 Tax=Ilex paraguariensis TaxID=185542 RepID=A0ABC8T821_9AQUA
MSTQAACVHVHVFNLGTLHILKSPKYKILAVRKSCSARVCLIILSRQSYLFWWICQIYSQLISTVTPYSIKFVGVHIYLEVSVQYGASQPELRTEQLNEKLQGIFMNVKYYQKKFIIIFHVSSLKNIITHFLSTITHELSQSSNSLLP